MKPTIRTIVTVITLSITLCGCLDILPRYTETQWYIQPDGTVLLKQYSFDFYYSGSSTSSAIKSFVSLVEDLEPPILTPTPSEDDKDMIILLRELQDKYGGLNLLQELEMPFETMRKGLDMVFTNGYYWIEFDTNKVTAETNGEITTHPEVKEGLLVRWSTNTMYIWYKTTQLDDDDSISLVEFWRQYCANGRDVSLLTNSVKRTE